MNTTKEARPKTRGKAKAKAKKAKRKVTAPAAKPSVCLPCMQAAGAAPINPTPRDPRRPCCVKTLTIRAPKREVSIQLPREAGSPVPVFHLVAEKSSGSREITFDLVGGPCTDGLNEHPMIEVFDDSGLVAADYSTLKYHVPGPELHDLNWRTVLFPFDLFHRYQSQALICDGGGAYVAELRVYPEVKYTIEIELPGITVGRSRSTDKHGDLELHATEANKEWGVSGEVEVGGWAFHLGGDFKKSLDDLCGFLAMGEDFFRFVDHVVELGGRKAITAEITALKLVAKAEFEQKESKKGLGLDWEIKLSVRFDPLLRTAVTLDIIETLMTAMGSNPIGAVIKWAYDHAIEDLSDPPVEVCLELSGTVGGGLTWSHTYGAERWETEKDFKGAIELKVWGKVQGKIRCFAVSAGASAKVTAKSGVWLKIYTESEAPPGEIAVQIGHDGITFSAAVAITYSGKVSSDEPEGSTEYEYEWIPPQTLPSEDDSYHFSFWKDIGTGEGGM